MIFERLTLHNFQRYGGTNTIRFPDPEESSLVVVLAPNNAGKTTTMEMVCLASPDSATDEAELAKLIEDLAEEGFGCWSRVAEWPRGDLRFMAMLTLARCCRDGNGTECDRQQAKCWFDRVMALTPKDKAE